MDRLDASTLRELRRARRHRRLGDVEWFDVLYRVYLFALVGMMAVITASDAIDGLIDDDVTTAEITTRGPAVAGLLAALAVAVGLRSGADGGPVAVESADVRHLLLSPVSRLTALLAPVAQRLRAAAFVPALVAAILGQLVAREVEGSRAAWAASGVLFGASLGLLYVATAVVAHAARVPRWAASAVGAAVVAWQSVSAITTWRSFDDAGQDAISGPFDVIGSLAFWGVRQRAVDVIGLAAVVALTGAALLLAGRLRLESLERRGQLVSQLRFAATVQDIRTVVVLRRQLRAESARSSTRVAYASAPHHTERARPTTRPTATRESPSPTVVWRRGLISMLRVPTSRLVRMAALAAVGGAAASLVVTSSYLVAPVAVGALFLLGLESIEPLAQEIDRPDRTDGLPIERGWLFRHHLVAPAGLLAGVALVGALVATLVEPGHALGAFALAVPVAWAGAIGPIVSTVRDAPDAARVAATTLTGRDRTSESPFALPEFAGASNVMSGLAPIVFSSTALGPVVAMRLDPTIASGVRSIVGVALCLGVMLWWIERRDAWALRLRAFFAEGRTA